MKFSLKQLFTSHNLINFFFILFLIGIVYALFSSKLVEEGFGCRDILQSKSCKKDKRCKWIRSPKGIPSYCTLNRD